MARKDLSLQKARAEKSRMLETGKFEKVNIVPRGHRHVVSKGGITYKAKMFEVKGLLNGKEMNEL